MRSPTLVIIASFCIGAEDELFDPLLKNCPFEEDPAIAVEAAEAYVGTEPGDLPVVAAARVGLAQPDDVAQVNF